MRHQALLVPLLALSAAVAALLQGCATPVAVNPESEDKQTAVYQAGTFRGAVDASMQTVFRHAIRVMDASDYFRTGEIHGEDSIKIFARMAGDKKVRVTIKPLEAKDAEDAPTAGTQINIRIGLLGSLPESQQLFAKIRKSVSG